MGWAFLKAVKWVLFAVLLGFVLLFSINATDEALSEEALAATKVPPPPAPSETNGFLDFLVLGAPAEAPTFETAVKLLDLGRKGKPDWLPPIAIDARIPICIPGNSSCLDAAAANPRLQELLDGHRVFLRRYRAMREKPEFIDLSVPISPEDPLPPYQNLNQGQRLTLLVAAVRFNAGDRTGAIRELELEFAFWRRISTGSRTLISKMLAFAYLDRTALFAADLARKIPSKETALWTRLEAMLRPPTNEELDLVGVVKQEQAQSIRWMETRRYVRMSDSEYELFKSFGYARSRPWWDPLAPYLYRPHQNVNRFVAQTNIMLEIANRPATEFFSAQQSLISRAQELEPRTWAQFILSPVGSWYLFYGIYDYSDYFARAHGHAGLQTLIRLQVRLRAAGIINARKVAQALAGTLGQAHPDPFTGKAMGFDPEHLTIGFKAQPKHLTGAARSLLKDRARVELPL